MSASSAPITYDQRTLSVPVAGVVKIVVLKGKEMMPAGKCMPIVKLKALGEACDRDDDCENSKCLTSVKDTSTTHSFTNGYCSEDCTKSKTCLSGGLCQAYNEFATNPVRYCLKKCSGNIDCRATEGYSCPGGACIP